MPFGFKLDRRSTALVYYPEYPDQTYELLEGLPHSWSPTIGRELESVTFDVVCHQG